MAEANPWTSRMQCRFYANGSCREAENCLYQHDSSAIKRAASPTSVVCRFFLKGRCSFGAQCRFKHTDADDHHKNKKGDKNKSRNFDKKDTKSSKSGKLTVLKKSSSESSDSGISEGPSPSTDPDKWVRAPEFVPGAMFNAEALSYSGKARSRRLSADDPDSISDEACATAILKDLPADRRTLCPLYLDDGYCQYGENCNYTHGDMCDYCQKHALHPLDSQHNKQHKEECLKEMESDMELSFAIQRSRDKMCGICMEVVLEKENPIERRFGLLSDCNHCFCLGCIRTWRQAKQFESKVIRSCPECRVSSDFVTPSKYWADDPDDKKKMIQGYKDALSKKPCRYFDQGRGECPFNEKCFYKHALPDGTIAEPKPRARRVRNNSQGDLELLQQTLLWDFLESRDSILDYSIFDVIDELFYNCSDTESDEDDDYDFLYLHL